MPTQTPRSYSVPPLRPLAITFDPDALTLTPEGPTLTRRMSDLEGLFADGDAWHEASTGENPVVSRSNTT